jgi:hypothetical protein
MVSDSLHGTQLDAYHDVRAKWLIVAVYKNYISINSSNTESRENL